MTDMPDEYRSLFPYEEAREAQKDGMNVIGEAVQNDGIVTMEGACGTGKTLTALVPYLSAVRSSDSDYERVMIVTSVKQQMTAFQDEIIRINESLPDGVRPVSALTLVSVSDLHPFVEKGVVDGDFDSIDSLREGARTLAGEDAHDYTYEELYQKAIKPNSNGDYAYPDEIPSADGIEYDPYYARYRASYDEDEDVEKVLPFNLDEVGMLTVEKLRSRCSVAGLCPHSMMRLAVEHVDVIIGNYYHAFDPKTVERISHPVIDENTVSIFDEAHNLVPRVREFLSSSVPLTSFARAIDELDEIAVLYELSTISDVEAKNVLNAASQDEEMSTLVGEKEELVERCRDVFSNSSSVTTSVDEIMEGRKKVRNILDEFEISGSSISEMQDFLDEFLDMVFERIIDGSVSADSSIQLREPDSPSRDRVSYWIELNGYESIARRTKMIGESVAMVRDSLTEASEKPQTMARSSGDLVSGWMEKDNTRYYRSVEFEERLQSSSYAIKKWQSELKAEMTIHNCIPKNEISDILGKFGSSVLMSATLEPIDVYNKTTGIKELEESGRDVYECRYGLEFPERNRLTIGVPANKFKYQNRGRAFDKFGPSTDNETREQYRDVVFDIVSQTDGNVLVIMPSYTEAEWIGSLLEQSYLCDTDDVYIDESSSNRKTTELKREFFNADDGVLVTGARGTLIEGIDYIGDRLKASVVCGVPLTDTKSEYKKAVKAAYEKIFDDMDGFTLAFTIPAVWKARQAIGRAIRTADDVGLRAFVDERYVHDNDWDSVHQFLSPSEQDEMAYIPTDDVGLRLETFWNMHE
jgi:DNA excision repair protein ERCC-2